MNTVTVSASRTYEVRIGSGLRSRCGEAVREIADKALIVTDETVAPLYLAQVYHSLTDAGVQTVTVSVPAGERSKNLETYGNLLHLFAAKGLSRADAVLALGGGVIGDLAGFAAATYLRGVKLIQMPTTLLAMVDASVGGKTAIDLPAGKNLVGAFYQPSLVLCDPEVLSSLPPTVFRDGCAEVIKTAILFDPALFAHLCERGPAFDREAVITRCVAHKRDVVCADEFDTGDRQKLNLGHTVAHAIEALSGFSVSHGCAVAIGLAVMARTFYPQPEEIERLLHTFGLPTTTDFSAEQLAEAALTDKKRAGETLTLVVPHAIGDCRLEKIPITDLCQILKAGLSS